MAFRKRNIAIGRSPGGSPTPAVDGRPQARAATTGVRASPLTSNAVTSTGTPSLDGLMGGHAGLALGSSILIEESGTTDFAGALLRYYAAEGICQGHVLHVVGVGEGWVRELPGVLNDKAREKQNTSQGSEDKMKIAWRYEKLGQTSERGASVTGTLPRGNATKIPSPSRGHEDTIMLTVSPAIPDRPGTISTEGTNPDIPFSHTFDLTKRLTIPPDAVINHIPLTTPSLDNITQSLTQSLSSSPQDSIHRVVIPSLLNPALYPPSTSRPENLLAFLLRLRSLLRQHRNRLTALLTLPLELHPRSSGLVHWAELLSDGVLELTPFPHSSAEATPTAPAPSSSAAKSGAGGGDRDERARPQGLFRIHRLPLVTERGEGGAGAGNSIGSDLAFTVSRRRFAIAPFALPPVEGDTEAQGEAGRVTGKDLEF